MSLYLTWLFVWPSCFSLFPSLSQPHPHFFLSSPPPPIIRCALSATWRPCSARVVTCSVVRRAPKSAPDAPSVERKSFTFRESSLREARMPKLLPYNFTFHQNATLHVEQHFILVHIESCWYRESGDNWVGTDWSVAQKSSICIVDLDKNFLSFYDVDSGSIFGHNCGR